MKESDFSRQVTEFIERRNGFVFNVTASRYQKADQPDLYIAHEYLKSGAVWLELKTNKNVCTPGQMKRIRELRDRNVDAYWLTKKEVDGEVAYILGNTDQWCCWGETLEDIWKYIIHTQKRRYK